MKSDFTITCRGSWLSLAQANIFIHRAQGLFPQVRFSIETRDTAGDRDQSQPLHLVEGRDFFTGDIQQFMRSGGADFAVHSMKDVSGDHFFGGSVFALIERDDPRDVLICGKEFRRKTESGEKTTIGTSSPRRAEMAIEFLKKSLPGSRAVLEAVPIRGNVDTRLRKLSAGEFDAIILAAAGLNRLLNFQPSTTTVRELLRDKHLVFLPLLECPPAPGQGAIVAETSPGNADAVRILNAINQRQLVDEIKSERSYAESHGGGCFQQFGAVHINTQHISFLFASGKNKDQREFSETNFDIHLQTRGKQLVSFTDHMKDIFNYRFLDVSIPDDCKAVFVASHKAVHSRTLVDQLKTRRVWVAGNKTWNDLVGKGILVEGSADGLGVDFIEPVMFGRLAGLSKSEMIMLTSLQSVEKWNQQGWRTIAAYELIASIPEHIEEKISEADIIFWTSFQQYVVSRALLKKNVIHCCAAGKTVDLFLEEGIQPVVFPGIKAFKEWNQKHIQSKIDG